MNAGQYFSHRFGLRSYIESGPYATLLDEWVHTLESRGIAPSTIQGYARAARHVTWSLEHRRLGRSDLTVERLREFVRAMPSSCGCPFPERPSNNARSAVKRFVPLLQRLGIAPRPKPNPYSALLAGYEAYLRDDRGVADDTLTSSLKHVSAALTNLMSGRRFSEKRLTTDAINRYVLRIIEQGHRTSARSVANCMRSFCKYLLATGQSVSVDTLAIKGPKQARYVPSAKALTLEQLRLILRPLRERTAIAARDFAILVLLGTTGVRRSDVARARLRDFNARSSTLLVARNKSRVGHEVPLTCPPDLDGYRCEPG